MNPLGMWTSFRSNVESYTAVLGGRFVSFVWIGAICALIWFFGPQLALFGDHPLASVRNRIIAIAGVLVIWGIWQLIRWRRAKRADAALIAGVTESPEARAAMGQAARRSVPTMEAMQAATLDVYRELL